MPKKNSKFSFENIEYIFKAIQFLPQCALHFAAIAAVIDLCTFLSISMVFDNKFYAIEFSKWESLKILAFNSTMLNILIH